MTDTFQIGNGKTAKVGDKVWDSTESPPGCHEIESVGVDVDWVYLRGYATTSPCNCFVTEREARMAWMERNLASAKEVVDDYAEKLSESQLRVARLEAMLASEGDGAKGSDDHAK